ncbi:sensor histidine kinase [Galactobacter valiniphilus]|uniref:histidine kinase n=1 Tax=Galactobacter valiniphilus TaxID=2676122 RepID=A0A399J7E3_9MICC|nr:sensor histidine kinase [Galactobacter valiniphilus]
MSLAGQLLALQLLVLLGVLAGVLYLSVAQSLRSFEALEGRRTLSAAEALAATPLVRTELPDAIPRGGSALPAALESVRSVSGPTYATLVDENGIVVASSDVTLVGYVAPVAIMQGALNRQWTGTADVAGQHLLLARVPVFGDDGGRVGVAVAAREYPSWGERLAEAAPDAFVALLACTAIGLGGSWLLSRRLKRQTLDMEPGEIAALVEHREALLHGVKEGIVAVDLEGRITVLNDAARAQLGWDGVREGTQLPTHGVSDALLEVVGSREEIADRPLLVGDRLLVANNKAITSHGRRIGSVTTLRDRTDLFELEDRLGTTQTTSDLLRAQTHEFANQLHTIAGLIQLGESQEALRFVEAASTERSIIVDAVTERVADAPLAALIVAKSSAAAERHVRLDLDPEAHLGPVSPELSRDLITVIGNLIDNALDAISGLPDAVVTLDLQDEAGTITVSVSDPGDGPDPALGERIFERGFSTKASDSPGGRGVGLALTRHVCRRRGGDVALEDGEGTTFQAWLPREPAPVRQDSPAPHATRSGAGAAAEPATRELETKQAGGNTR